MPKKILITGISILLILGICISYSALTDNGANKTNTISTANNLIIE